MNIIDSIQQEYEANKDVYTSLESVTFRLMKSLISKEEIQIHSITSRCKTEASLLEKVTRPDKNYSSINDITDIVGIRIISYFTDEVDLLSQLIEREFIVDKVNSIDKRKAFESDRFGYMSLHLVVEHLESRTKLAKYKNFKGIKFEIQIRTILQHAWAEIEHDIGYKSKSHVPIDLRRRFSRLSGILELVDEEFHSIRKEINAYKSELPENIRSSPASVMLDLDSLESFIKNDELVRKIETEFSEVLKCPLIKSQKVSLRRFLGHVNRLGISTIDELKSAYEESEPFIISYLITWLGVGTKHETKPKLIHSGISLLYVCRIILALKKDEKLFASYLESPIYKSKGKIKTKILKTFDQINKVDI